MFLPFSRMEERLSIARQDSDTTYFHDLLRFGEMVLKSVACGFVAAVGDDRNRSRYRQLHRLVRASSIGEWDEVVEEVLFGTASQFLIADAYSLQNDLTQKHGDGSWQKESVELLATCVKSVDSSVEAIPKKVNARQWLKLFVRLRNKVAHGSITTQIAGQLSEPLAASISTFCGNAEIFAVEWAYLHRNLSGKYRVSAMSSSSARFEPLRKTNSEQYPAGVYIHIGQPRAVELMSSDVDLSDFFIANGGFNGQRFEMLSYVTGAIRLSPSAPYLVPADQLPSSSTHGFSSLEVRGKAFTNAPKPEGDYVTRSDLEREVKKHIEDRDLHRIVTLHGRGGVGKTSVALRVIEEIAHVGRYDVILWFSARDIDLLIDGPKPVKPQVFTIKEMAREFVRFADFSSSVDDAITTFARVLGSQEIGPILFVFDNFETIESPPEAYVWIDTYIRHPNKALITTRHREFKGDYSIEVPGMTEEEANELTTRHAKRLGVSHVITQRYAEELYREADGHPYIIKLLLGEVARLGYAPKVERIIADRDEMLTALFERTYAKLSPAAQRVFMTLSGWRSAVPLIALQAALLRSIEDRLDVQEAVEELVRYSFVELVRAEADKSYFVSTPLAAAAFGKRKLLASSMKSAIDVDVAFLQLVGPTQREDIDRGLAPRIERLLRTFSDRLSASKITIEDHIRVLQFLASKYPPVWLWLSDIFDERGDIEHAIDYVRRFLEVASQDRLSAWKRLAELCGNQGDSAGEIHALVGMSESSTVDISVVSMAANRVNQLFREKPGFVDTEEKRLLVQRLVEIFVARATEATPTDLSRLAWLKLHLRDENGARIHVKAGLASDPGNTYLLNLARRLGMSPSSGDWRPPRATCPGA